MSRAAKTRGPWSLDEIGAYLADTVIPVRLAVNTGSGFPIVVSLWFVPDAEQIGGFWCAVHESARLVAHLRRDPACAFEIARDAPPYFGVRGQGEAELIAERGGAVLRDALDRYLGGDDGRLAKWLLSRSDDELAIRVSPTTLFSWDYRQRMSE